MTPSSDHFDGERFFNPTVPPYAPFFSEVRRRQGLLDLALLPIGAYEPRWFMHAVHMNPGEAVQAHVELGAAESIGMHFGTFKLTAEGIDAPVRALEEARRARNMPPDRFRAIGFGDSVRCLDGTQGEALASPSTTLKGRLTSI